MYYLKLLENNEFFIGLKLNEIEEILDSVQYSIEKYSKGSIIANEEDECNSIGLILEGLVEIQRIYPSGNTIIVKRLKSGDVFGEALVFSKKSTYPATVISAMDSKILFINKNEILRLCLREEKILENFISLLSDKVFMLNNKVKSLAFKSVREKVINFILGLHKNQQNDLLKLKNSKEDIALHLGIPRPSLSRELIKLREDGLIEFDRVSIKILDLEALEDELFK